MPSAPDLKALKRLVSPALLKLCGVSGVGITGDALRVYLEEDTESVKERVRKLVATHDGEVAVVFQSTGSFKAQ